jgi:two-component system, NarL family, invasion response regulator UvrY
MIRLAVIDDHDLIRTGFTLILAGDPEFKVIAEGSRGDDAILIARKYKPDVILLDISMPGGISGVEALSRLMAMEEPPKVIIVSQHEELELLRRTLNAGASGYVGKSAGADELKSAIRKVMQGRRYVSQDLAQALALAGPQSPDQSPFAQLSAREYEVAMSIVAGERGVDLAARLFISAKTVSTHKRTMFEKLGIKTEAELIKLALMHGFAPEAVIFSKLVSLDGGPS